MDKPFVNGEQKISVVHPLFGHCAHNSEKRKPPEYSPVRREVVTVSIIYIQFNLKIIVDLRLHKVL